MAIEITSIVLFTVALCALTLWITIYLTYRYFVSNSHDVYILYRSSQPRPYFKVEFYRPTNKAPKSDWVEATQGGWNNTGGW